MKFRILLATLLLATGQFANADRTIVTVINAVELSPANMILPGSTNGMMTYRPCSDECEVDYERARLTPETSYSVEGAAVRFEDFQREFAIARTSDSGYALLSVDVKTKTVTSIDISR